MVKGLNRKTGDSKMDNARLARKLVKLAKEISGGSREGAGISRKADSGDVVMYFNTGDMVKPSDGSRMMTREQSELADAFLQNTVENLYTKVQNIVEREFARKYEDDLAEVGLELK